MTEMSDKIAKLIEDAVIVQKEFDPTIVSKASIEDKIEPMGNYNVNFNL